MALARYVCGATKVLHQYLSSLQQMADADERAQLLEDLLCQQEALADRAERLVGAAEES
jgi:hypothetical protein